MSENMPKPPMLPVLNHFQYARSFIGTYQHLCITAKLRRYCVTVKTFQQS